MQLSYIIVRSSTELKKQFSKSTIVKFLHRHLIEFRDPPEMIEAAIDYTLSTADGKGGFLTLQFVDSKLTGVVVINSTGMSGYIPENLLVYIAVDDSRRGQGLGTKLMQRVFEEAEGNIALHVEYDNPAKRLYERLGFTSKYAEMRYRGDK